MKRFIQRALLCSILLMVFAAAQAASYNFNGNAVNSSCPLSGTTYTCSSIPLSGTDSVTIASGYTVIVNGAFSPGYNNSVTMGGTAVLHGASGLNFSAIYANNVRITGGTLSSATTINFGYNMDVTANISAATLGGVNFKVTGNLSVSGAILFGSGVRITGNITSSSFESNDSTVVVNGNISTSGKIKLASGATINGNISGAEFEAVGSPVAVNGNINVTGPVSLASGANITGNISGTVVKSTGNPVTITGNVNASTSFYYGYANVINGNLISPKVELDQAAKVTGDVTAGSVLLQYQSRVIQKIYCTGSSGINPCSCVTNNSTYPFNSPEGPSCAAAQTAGVDHYELSLPTTGVNCLPMTVTVKACANSSSPCTSLYTAASGSIVLTTSAGATIGTATFSSSDGTASTTLSYPAAAEGATATVSLPASATNICCPVGGTCSTSNSCSATFNKSGFIFSATQGGVATNIGAQVAGTSSLTYYLRAVKSTTTSQACEAALTGTQAVNLGYRCNNPATCSSTDLMSVNGVGSAVIKRNNNTDTVTYTSANLNFDANGNAPFTLNYGDVGQVTVYASKTVVNSAVLTGISNAFVVKPGGFTLSGIMRTANSSKAVNTATTAAGEVFLKAGDPFTATVTATTSGGATTPNFGKETPAEEVNLTASAAIDPDRSPAGVFVDMTQLPNPAGTFSGFISGVATSSALSWDSVGIVMLTPKVADGDYLGAGAVTGTAAKVGRFTPSYFAVTSPSIVNRAAILGCSASTFSYMGEQLIARFRLEARNSANAIAANYTGKFAKLIPDANVAAAPSDGPLHAGAVNAATTRTVFPVCGGTPAHPCFTPAKASGAFAAGVATIDLPLTVFRGAPAAGPYASFSVGIAPIDSDDVAIKTMDLDTVNAGVGGANNHARVGTTVLRYGRMKIDNGYGSELLGLPVKLQAQYWDGSNFITNLLDSCSSLAPGNFSLSGTAITTTVVGNGTTMVNGVSNGFALSKPSPVPTAKGSVVLKTVAPLADYLPGSATQTFGVYKSGPMIYIREVY